MNEDSSEIMISIVLTEMTSRIQTPRTTYRSAQWHRNRNS